MDAPIRAVLIGCGSLSLRGILPHLSQPDARQLVDLVGIADLVGERAQAAAALFGISRHTADASELLADETVDLAIVATPIPTHHRVVMGALQAEKHVYVQKTMATHYDEAAEMLRAARERDLVLAAAPGQLLAPAVREARAFVQAREPGPIYWGWGVTPGWAHEDETPRRGTGVLDGVDPSWYYGEGGGPVYDTAVYMLHTLTGILGPVRRVVALSGTRIPTRDWQQRQIPLSVDDNTMMLLDFGKGLFAFCGAMSGMTGQVVDWGSFGLYGAGGFIESLEIEPLSGHPARVVFGSAGGSHREVAYGVGCEGGWLPRVDATHAGIEEPHVYADIMDCADAILNRRNPAAAADHAAHVVEVIEQCYEAARTGQAIELRSSFTAPSHRGAVTR
jgi:predicted dehydrogenase